MHARLDELLSLRDGDPVAASVGEHLEGCELCTGELRRLKRLRESLRALPLQNGTAPGWPAVNQELARRERGRDLRRRQARYVAAASLGAVALMLGLRIGDSTRYGNEAPVQLQATALPAEDGSGPALEAMRRRSQELEALLAVMPRRPAVERADVGVPIRMLEERLQRLDHELSVGTAAGGTGTAGEEALWRDRVEALDTLVSLRYVEAQRTAF